MKKTRLHNFIEVFSKRNSSLPIIAQRAFFDILEKEEKEMAEINREQLDDGEYTSSKDIFPAYTALTVSIKKAKGQRFDKVTLRDTGDFHNSIIYDVIDNSVVISASDSKTNKLNKKYRRKTKEREIYGLQPERYNNSIYPKVKESTNELIFDTLFKNL
jgi:hypothetical protein